MTAARGGPATTSSPPAEELMAAAFAKAREGMRRGQSPFGCAIAVDGEIVSVAHNTVIADADPTAHAEVNAIQRACQRQATHHLPGAVVATTCEPCPMCMAALHWARVADVHYAATIADATAAGFNELSLDAASLLEQGGSNVRLHAGPMSREGRELFQQWLDSDSPQAY